MIVKHATASVFLFAPLGSGWQLGLIHHPRFRRWMLPGGHVESHENPAETAQRELAEETGLRADLLTYPALPAPGQLEQPVITPPLWIIEEFVPPEDREPNVHIHIDFLYAATTHMRTSRMPSEFHVAWFGLDQLAELGLFGDTLLLARQLHEHLSALRGSADATCGNPVTARRDSV